MSLLELKNVSKIYGELKALDNVSLHVDQGEWVAIMALIVLLIAFAMMIHERRREFAVLRLLGVSRRGLRAEILAETGLCSLAGALLGIGIAAAGVFPFTTLIETRLGLPYLTPSAGGVLSLASVTLLATLLVGGVAGAWAAARLSRVDPGVALREGA